MIPVEKQKPAYVPVEMLNEVLERIWDRLCITYDVNAEMPGLTALFNNVDLSNNGQAAQAVMVNMLCEIIESVSRFSAWYKKPARAFGLVSVRDGCSNNPRWLLASEAVYRWRNLLDDLAAAIRGNSGLIQAVVLVEDLINNTGSDDPCKTVVCACSPARQIRLRKSILGNTKLICEFCQKPFA